jgi:hypothetical protein
VSQRHLVQQQHELPSRSQHSIAMASLLGLPGPKWLLVRRTTTLLSLHSAPGDLVFAKEYAPGGTGLQDLVAPVTDPGPLQIEEGAIWWTSERHQLKL